MRSTDDSKRRSDRDSVLAFLFAVVKFLARRIRRVCQPQQDFYKRAYSQEGEDLILQRIFHRRASGFYVDVGAHHPRRFSNTHLFYELGWTGINIDALPGSMDAFRRERPRDFNVEVAIANASGEHRTLYIFDEPALNSLDEQLAHSREGGPDQRTLISQHDVLTSTLKDVLEAHLPTGEHIDFLSVDVEGLDLEVLQSNAWDLYRPTYVLAECYGIPWARLGEEPVCRYLESQGYELFAKTVNTVFFKDRSAPPVDP